MEVVEINNKSAILMTSGGGILDDGSAKKDDGETDPGEFGW